MKKITLTILTFVFLTSAVYAEDMKAFQGVKTTPLTQEELELVPTPMVVELAPPTNNQAVELLPNDDQVVELLPPDEKKVVELLPD